MFFDDDEGDGFDNFGGFSALNVREVEKTNAALAILEARLYNSDNRVEMIVEVPEVTDEFRRFDATGYSAHTDSVEEHEIRDWKRAFPYLRVEGKGFGISASKVEDSNEGVQQVVLSCDGAKQNTDLQVISGDDAALQLVVTGSSIQPRVEGDKLRAMNDNTSAHSLQCDAEEIFAIHGILEEIIEIDKSPPDLTVESPRSENAALGDPISPIAAQQCELVSILIDALWPELVKELEPLVRKVVHRSRAAGLTYPTEPEATNSTPLDQEAHDSMDLENSGW